MCGAFERNDISDFPDREGRKQEIRIELPPKEGELEKLEIGDVVYLSGVIYTARDAAHKRMADLLDEGKPLPMDIKNQAIFYAGPSPAKPGQAIGSCGPTSSYRMDRYTPRLLDLGLKIMIGKGNRSYEVIEAMRRNKAVYLAAIGGAGALSSTCVKKCELIGFADLGPEAIYRLEVENFALIVAIDTKGNNLYEEGPKQYRKV